MKKILAFILLVPYMANAQFSENFLSSKNQQLIEDAVNNGFFILHQSYQLKDSLTNEYYGRAGRNEFGVNYTLGVKTQKGYVIPGKAVQPWNYDENFNKYRSTHIPVIYKTKYKALGQDDTYKEIAFQNRTQTELIPGMIYQVEDSIFNFNGFEVESSPGKKEGWLVWVTADHPMEKADSASRSFIIYRNQLDIQTDKKEYEIQPPSTDKNIWGGVFLVPDYTSIGKITFRLAGIMEKEHDKWSIVTPFLNRLNEKTVEETVEETGNETDELTPVTDKSEDKKARRKTKK